MIGEPLVGVKARVVENDGFEEIDYLFVLGVLGPIAGDVEGGETGGMLAEFVLWLCQPCSTSCLLPFEKQLDLHPKDPGSGSSARSSTCSCTRAGRTDRTVPGKCQCQNHCMQVQMYHLVEHS